MINQYLEVRGRGIWVSWWNIKYLLIDKYYESNFWGHNITIYWIIKLNMNI